MTHKYSKERKTKKKSKKSKQNQKQNKNYRFIRHSKSQGNVHAPTRWLEQPKTIENHRINLVFIIIVDTQPPRWPSF